MTLASEGIFSIVGARGLPCGLLARLGISVVFPLCIRVSFLLCWAAYAWGLLMEA